MAKTDKKPSGNALRKANIAVIIVVAVAALIIIAIAVMSAVHVDPVRAFDAPTRYALYDKDSNDVEATNGEAQSKIRIALDDMKFSVMSAVFQWTWDYSYNFKHNADGDKIEVSAAALKDNSVRGEGEYLVELVYDAIPVVGEALDYSKAHSIEVDGETVYFDRVKIFIGNTDGSVGNISIYPYIYARLDNESDIDGIASDTYKVTGINVRADTSRAYVALGDIVKMFD